LHDGRSEWFTLFTKLNWPNRIKEGRLALTGDWALVGKSEGNAPHRRQGINEKYDIEMDHRWDGNVVEWILPVRDGDNWPAVVSEVVKFHLIEAIPLCDKIEACIYVYIYIYIFIYFTSIHNNSPQK